MLSVTAPSEVGKSGIRPPSQGRVTPSGAHRATCPEEGAPITAHGAPRVGAPACGPCGGEVDVFGWTRRGQASDRAARRPRTRESARHDRRRHGARPARRPRGAPRPRGRRGHGGGRAARSTPTRRPGSRRRWCALVEGGATRVVLDLGGVGFIDSSGLRVLIATRKRLGEDTEAVVLRHPTPGTLRLLEMTGLTEQFSLALSRRDRRVAAFSPAAPTPPPPSPAGPSHRRGRAPTGCEARTTRRLPGNGHRRALGAQRPPRPPGGRGPAPTSGPPRTSWRSPAPGVRRPACERRRATRAAVPGEHLARGGARRARPSAAWSGPRWPRPGGRARPRAGAKALELVAPALPRRPRPARGRCGR